MTVHSTNLERFLPAIAQLPNAHSIEKSDLLTEQFLMEKEEVLAMYYAPHNEYINREARLIVVGITPGWTQMKVAFQEARTCIGEDVSLAELIKRTKCAARFAGRMRENMISMLDACGIPEVFHISSSRTLFSDNEYLLHTTSVVKYPVFVDERNYTGYRPRINQSLLLKKYAYERFPEEVAQLKNRYLLIPLGKVVTGVVNELVLQGNIPEQSVLFGFPHPSGANGHRVRQFQQALPRLQSFVKNYRS